MGGRPLGLFSWRPRARQSVQHVTCRSNFKLILDTYSLKENFEGSVALTIFKKRYRHSEHIKGLHRDGRLFTILPEDFHSYRNRQRWEKTSERRSSIASEFKQVFEWFVLQILGLFSEQNKRYCQIWQNLGNASWSVVGSALTNLLAFSCTLDPCTRRP